MCVCMYEDLISMNSRTKVKTLTKAKPKRCSGEGPGFWGLGCRALGLSFSVLGSELTNSGQWCPSCQYHDDCHPASSCPFLVCHLIAAAAAAAAASSYVLA